MPRKKSSVNYKKNLLVSIVLDILPNAENGWQSTAIAYQKQSNKEALLDSSNL
jgi:hypothetical protein